MKNNGVSVPKLLLFVFLLSAIGIVGWLMYGSQKSDEDTASLIVKQTAVQQQTTKDSRKTFDCNGIFSLKYPEEVSVSMTTSDPPQCLVSNVSTEEMPPRGPLSPEQLGLFFNTNETTFSNSEDYLSDYIERSKQDYELILKDQESITLDNNKTATLATVYGGHPGPHDFYFFVYVDNGKVVTTDSLPVNTNHKDFALSILKSINLK